jgi:hypothetical protein
MQQYVTCTESHGAEPPLAPYALVGVSTDVALLKRPWTRCQGLNV